MPLHFRAARFFPRSLAALAAPGAVDEQRRRLRSGGAAADEALSAPAAALAALGLAGAARGELHLLYFASLRDCLAIITSGKLPVAITGDAEHVP